MSDARRTFLVTLFQALAANGVRYCVQRNYDQIYTDTDTDVDLLLSPYSLARFQRCLRETAATTAWHLVQAVRFGDHSWVFWQPTTGFLRIDFATEVRWQLFPVLSARDVLDSSVACGEFYVPAPEVESVILLTAALWRGKLSERYRQRLAVLHARSPDRARQQEIFARAFGGSGIELAAFQARAATAVFDAALVGRGRRSLALTALTPGRKFASFLGHLLTDAGRLRERWCRPAGVSLLLVSSQPRARSFADLTARLEFLFPEQKNTVIATGVESHAQARKPWSREILQKRRRTLFKGGLFVRAYQVPTEADLARVVRSHTGYAHPERTFVCVEDRTGTLYLAHLGSGVMTTIKATAPLDETAFGSALVRFFATVLERPVRASPTKTFPAPRGLFCVLVGLDGSGKTTLARNLCELTGQVPQFSGVRYSHWRPKIFGAGEIPLPEFQNQPRKPVVAPSAMNSVLSLLRLAKNALLIRLAWWLQVRPAVRRGQLVLVDRYYYNYYLDPTSVKFSAPRRWLDLARRLFPRPDLVLTLHAPPEILLQRKQELSAAEMQQQSAVLASLDFAARRVARVDATQDAAKMAQSALGEIIGSLPRD